MGVLVTSLEEEEEVDVGRVGGAGLRLTGARAGMGGGAGRVGSILTLGIRDAKFEWLRSRVRG